MAKAPDIAAHMKHKGTMLIVIGILVILNAVYSMFSWAEFVGGLFILVGLISLVMASKHK
ncbi:hypothetical protein GOV06_05895 [Candidatus Woesearchaeota archaeon]|nr:hypothetical protein [Candidatus Woesearchaeota archaeon]